MLATEIVNNTFSLIFKTSFGKVYDNNIVNESADILVMMTGGMGVLAWGNYWGKPMEPNFLSPRRKCLPIYAPILFFPWSLKPVDIPQTWPD